MIRAAIACALALTFMSPTEVEAITGPGKIAYVEGAVRVHRANGQIEQADVGMTLFKGDTVRTGRSGRTQVSLAASGIVRLQANGTMHLSAAEDDRVQLGNGDVFEVKTPVLVTSGSWIHARHDGNARLQVLLNTLRSGRPLTDEELQIARQLHFESDLDRLVDQLTALPARQTPLPAELQQGAQRAADHAQRPPAERSVLADDIRACDEAGKRLDQAIEELMQSQREMRYRISYVYDSFDPRASLARSKLDEAVSRHANSLNAMKRAYANTRQRLVQHLDALPPDVAKLRVIPNAKTPLDYIFEARTENAPQGEDIAFQWMFEDANEQWKSKATRAPSVTHTYSAPGTYTVRLLLVRSSPEFSEPLAETSITVEVAGPTTSTAVTHHGDYTLHIGIWNSEDDNPGIHLTVHPESGTFEAEAYSGFSYHKEAGLGPCREPFLGNVEYRVSVQFAPVQGTIDLKTGRFSGISKAKVTGERFVGASRLPDGAAAALYELDDQGRFVKGLHMHDVTTRPGMVVYPAGIAGAFKALGFNPRSDDITGRLTGKVDLVRGGGTARFAPQRFEERVWSVQGEGFVGVGFDFPQGPLPPQSRARLGLQQIAFRLYPTVDDAKEALVRLPNSVDVGDETRFDRHRFQTRLGRLVIDARAARPLTEQTIRQQMEYTLETVGKSALYPQLHAGK